MMEELGIKGNNTSEIQYKCNGWKLSRSGYPLDPCKYEEIAIYIDKFNEKKYNILKCEVCGFYNVGWEKTNEENHEGCEDCGL